MKKSSTSSISAVTLLTLVFVVLKLTHVIGWSWWWVLSPLWISAAIAVVFVLIWCVYAILKKKYGKTLLIVSAMLSVAASFSSCESCGRELKSMHSDFNGGLERTATLYDYNGDTIGYWEGKFDIRDHGSDNQIFFDLNNKRIWIQGGIFVSEEK